MPRQRKRAAGRLRLLFAAPVATTISVVGAVGTASAVPQPTTGVLEICKAASGDGVGGFAQLTVQGRPGVIEVRVGCCSLPIPLPVGPATVTEVERPGFSVEGIATFPTTRLVHGDKTARRAVVSIVAGGEANQTMLTFTNKVTPKGFLEVFKAKPDRDKLDGFSTSPSVRPAARPRP